MYAIIYWKDDNSVYPYLNNDGTLRLFETLVVADNMANSMEEIEKIDARVISIEGVEE